MYHMFVMENGFSLKSEFEDLIFLTRKTNTGAFLKNKYFFYFFFLSLKFLCVFYLLKVIEFLVFESFDLFHYPLSSIDVKATLISSIGTLIKNTTILIYF